MEESFEFKITLNSSLKFTKWETRVLMSKLRKAQVLSIFFGQALSMNTFGYLQTLKNLSWSRFMN